MTMTPVALIMLLECYFQTDKKVLGMSPNRQEVIHLFELNNLVTVDVDSVINITNKGMFYIEHLLNITLPVETTKFVIPDEKQT